MVEKHIHVVIWLSETTVQRTFWWRPIVVLSLFGSVNLAHMSAVGQQSRLFFKFTLMCNPFVRVKIQRHPAEVLRPAKRWRICQEDSSER